MNAGNTKPFKFKDPAVDNLALRMVEKIVVLEAVIDAMTAAAVQREAELERWATEAVYWRFGGDAA